MLCGMCVVYVCMPNVSEVINGQRAQQYEATTIILG